MESTEKPQIYRYKGREMFNPGTTVGKFASRGGKGFTLIEMLVAISIIALVIALLIPAIQGGRESARRAQCSNNLRQFGVAMHDFDSTRGCLPTSQAWGSSIHVQLLPYLDNGTIYDSLNFNRGLLVINRVETAYTLRLGIFTCPSDPDTARVGTTSYAGCVGDGTEGSFQVASNGLFPVGPPAPLRVTSADVRDGMSHTAAMCEWLVMPKTPPATDPRRIGYRISIPKASAQDAAAFVRACRARSGPGESPGAGKGMPWFAGAEEMTLYNHAMPINGNSCSPTESNVISSATTAGSLHAGGVNLLLGDGHARFVRDSIDFAVWKALSTTARGEPIAGDY